MLPAVDADAGEIGAAGEPMRADAGNGRLARGSERMERRYRGGVVDYPFERGRQTDQLTKPSERHLFELRCGGRGAPEHRLLVERGREELGEHPWRAARNREVREEARMVPVRDARQDDAFEVREDRVEADAVFGRMRRQIVSDLSRAHAREYGKALGVLEVVGDPVRERVGLAAEIVHRIPRAPDRERR